MPAGDLSSRLAMTARVSSEVARRAGSFALSLSLHAGIFAFLWWMPPLPPGFRGNPPRARAMAEVKPLLKNPRIIWVRPNQRLPDIAPRESAAAKPDGPARKDALYVRAKPENARFKDQFIFTDRPKIEVQQPLPSPNVVMTEVAPPPPPPKPQPRKFVPPPQRVAESKPAELTAPEISVAQQLETQPPKNLFGEQKPLPRAPAKKFAALPKSPVRPRQEPLLELPTGIETAAGVPGGAAQGAPFGEVTNLPKAPAKKFTALPRSPGAGGQGSLIEVPTGVDGGTGPPGGAPQGAPGPVTAVIISANPVANGKIVVPEGNRPAEISAGGGSGGGTGKGEGGGVVVPGLSLRGGGGGTGAAGVSTERLPEPAPAPAAVPTRPAYRPRLDTPSVSIPQWPRARRVPAQVETVFAGRPVYSTVIPGSADARDWVLWFGEQPSEKAAGRRVVMRPPRLAPDSSSGAVPRVTGAGKCWIRAQLNKDGKLISIEVTQGGTQEWRQLARTIGNWNWTPAIRNGEAVTVDVLLEVELIEGDGQ